MLEVDGAGLQNVSLIVPYMPHCGYSDVVVDDMYVQISKLVSEARKKKHVIVIGADWNAEVRSSNDQGDSVAVGSFANDVGNARGEWLANWAAKDGLMLANSFFQKPWRKRWTHVQHGRRRQIDYFIVERKRRESIRDAYTSNALDLGSDHRAVKMVMELCSGAGSSNRK